MIGNFGIWEIAAILILVLILFGGRKIPQLAKDLGSGIREFKKSLSGTEKEITDGLENDDEEIVATKKKSRKKTRSS